MGPSLEGPRGQDDLEAEFQLRKMGRDSASQFAKERVVAFVSHFSLNRGRTCRTEGSDGGCLFLFVIFSPRTDFDFVCYRKNSSDERV